MFVLDSDLKRFHEDLTELSQKQKYDEMICIQTRIWSYLTQFLTIFDEPRLKMTGNCVEMWPSASCNMRTSLDQFILVFCSFTRFFKHQRLVFTGPVH